MSHPVSSPAAFAPKKPRVFVWFGWAGVLLLAIYFLQKYALHYFIFTPQSYGAYFWPRISWVVPHVAAGLLALVLGPMQFWPAMRRDFLPAHRIAGRVYVVAVVIGSLAAYGLASKIGGSPTYSLGLIGLGTAWLTTTVMAFVAIRRKNLAQHREWMVRSYVVTFAFVTFRLCDDGMRELHLLNDDERSKLLAWACWAIPLLVTELILQGRAVFRTRG